LYLLLDRTSLVIRRMISTKEDTSDIIRFFFSVALSCQVVICAFDASWFEMAIIFGVPISVIQFAHKAISLLCLGGSNFILHYLHYFALFALFGVPISVIQFAHKAISLLCLGGSNFILHCCTGCGKLPSFFI
jgi:hypothetical protein